MKVGIVSGAIAPLGDSRYEKLKALGFSALDLSMANTEDGLYLCSEQEFCERLTRERELASSAGIEIYQLHGPWRVPIRDGSAEERAERMDKMKKAVRAAKLLGAKCTVIHPIMPFGIFDIEKQKTKETWDINLTFMRELASYAVHHGVTVCLENMPFPTFSLSKPDKIRDMIGEVDSERFKMCLDIGHVNVFPDLSVADELKKHRDVIRAVHIHDNDGKGDNHALPYFGTIDWKTFGKTFRALDLPCPFSYETAPPKKLPQPIYETYLKSMVDMTAEILGQ